MLGDALSIRLRVGDGFLEVTLGVGLKVSRSQTNEGKKTFTDAGESAANTMKVLNSVWLCKGMGCLEQNAPGGRSSDVAEPEPPRALGTKQSGSPPHVGARKMFSRSMR